MFRTLIVDDSSSELEVLLFLIQKNNLPLKTTTAVNGEEALSYLEKETFDILITDIKMPFMDGLTLAREALRCCPSIKIVISSGYQDFSYAKTAISLGVEEYLLKPIVPSDFILLISKITEQIEAEKQSLRENRMKTIYSRDSIMQQLINGSLRPGKNGLLSQEVRGLMPSSCSLILLSADKENASSLLHLKSEILQLADQLFEYPVRCISLKTDLLLSVDSTDSSYTVFLEKNASVLAERFMQMYHIPLRTAVGHAPSPEGIAETVSSLKSLLSQTQEDSSEGEIQPRTELYSSGGKVRFVCDYIASHYQEDLSLESLSQIAYIHPDYLSRIFKKETGMNLNRYIKTFRLNKARSLLENSQQKINAVSAAVGYQNCAYFIRSFTEMFGQSPEKYRQKHRENLGGNIDGYDE